MHSGRGLEGCLLAANKKNRAKMQEEGEQTQILLGEARGECRLLNAESKERRKMNERNEKKNR